MVRLGQRTCVSSAIVASRNHGKFSNGTNRSRPCTKSQKPDGDTFATSTAEVSCPGCTDLISMLLNDLASCVYASPSEPIVGCQFDPRLQPELRFAAGMLHVYVRPGLLTREEVEPVATYA